MASTAVNHNTTNAPPPPLYWVSVAVSHLTGDNNNVAADPHRRVWWPCVCYKSYVEFQQDHHGMSCGSTTFVTKRILENLLEGKRVSIAKLITAGSEENENVLQNYVEIVHPLKVHRSNGGSFAAAANEEEFTLTDLHAHQTLWQTPFSLLQESEMMAQVSDPQNVWASQELYQNFMAAMDVVMRQQQVVTTHNNHSSESSTARFAALGQQQWQLLQNGAAQQEEGGAAAPIAAAMEQDTQQETAAAAVAAATATAAEQEAAAMEQEDKTQEESENEAHHQDKDDTSVAAGTVVTHDSSTSEDEQQQQKVPAINPRDSFQVVTQKLLLRGTWDTIEYQGKEVWIQTTGMNCPNTHGAMVLGKDYFDEDALKEYLQTNYGWKRPRTDKKKSPPAIAAADKTTPQVTNGRKTNTASAAAARKQGARNVFVTPSPKLRKESPTQQAIRRRTSGRKRVERSTLKDEEKGMLDQLMLDRSKKQKKAFTFQSQAEADFYYFHPLMRKLEKTGGWKYKTGKLGGYEYILPGRNGARKGGQVNVDYFTEEDDVVEYCMQNKYYDRRQELGLGA